MKKIIVLLISFLFLTSCGTSKIDIEKAKKEMLEWKNSQEEVVSKKIEIKDTKKEGTIKKKEEKEQTVEIKKLTEKQFIELDDIPTSSVMNWEVKISGKTLWEVEKIEVLFSNSDSIFPDDDYTLQTFKPWANSFRYIASSKFQVFDFWKNIYTIKAYSGKEVSEVEITINIPKEKTKVTYEEKIIGWEDDSVELALPVSESFWNPISLWENSFTYSDINGLEIVKKEIPELTSDTVTEYLTENINTWFYWNTFRDIIKDKWVSFYVLRLSWDGYVYEKHYIDTVHKFYAIYEVETGDWITKENISEKNNEFKEKNDNFENVALVDSLMKKILVQK